MKKRIKNVTRYIIAMLIGSITFDCYTAVNLVIACTITGDRAPSILECCLMAAAIFPVIFAALIFEIRPYSEWEENADRTEKDGTQDRKEQ